jgi:ABC-2 type transport system ATP-binding protein
MRAEGLREVVAEALERIGLTERADHRAAFLSGGMQRRLNIVAGTLHRPRVLLLDEPTVGVDPRAREGIHALLGELRRAGLALLLTTHDMEEAAGLADRIAFLVEGRITAEGTPAELIARTFGTDRELIVTLGREPGSREREVLADSGLAPTRVDKVWTGRLAGDIDTASTVASRMRQAGLAVSEFRIREPGLQGVFLHLTGREFHR